MNDLDQLALLDPARDRSLSDIELLRAEANLERILAEPHSSAPVGHKRLRGFVLASGAGVAAVTGLVVVALSFGSGAAYADWTAVPDALSPQQALAQAQACATSWNSEAPLELDNIVLAERRGTGKITIVQEQGVIRLCSAVEPNSQPGWETLYDPTVSTEMAPVPNGLRIFGIETDGDGKDGYAYDVGRVGSEVTGVDVLTPEGPVHATVQNGWFLAWWPGATNDNTTSRLVIHTSNQPDRIVDWQDFAA